MQGDGVMNKIKMVWAEDQQHAIGKDGTIPWHIADDLKLFKAETLNTLTVMGRATWDSIGRPLPKRTNVVLTRQETWQSGHESVKVVHSVDEVIQLFKQCDQDMAIIGGAEIFKLFMPFADELVITRVQTTIDGDTFVDDINRDDFTLQSQKNYEKNDNNDYAFVVEHYLKK